MHWISVFRPYSRPNHPRSHGLPRWPAAFLVVAAWIGCLSPSAAESLPPTKLQWDRNSERNIAGYILRYGTRSGQYDKQIRVGKQPKATVTGLKAGTTYYFAVAAYNRQGHRSRLSKEVVFRSKPAEKLRQIPRDSWKTTAVDTGNDDRFPLRNAFDGKPSSFWKAPAAAPGKNAELRLDLGRAHTLKGFVYLPRQEGTKTGHIGKYALYLSMNGRNWGKPAAAGTFGFSRSPKRVLFPATSARYVKLVSLRDVNGNRDLAIAELDLLKAPDGNPSAKSIENAMAANLTAATSAPPASHTARPKVSFQFINDRKHLVMTVPKPANPDGFTRTVQVSPNLVDWFSGARHTTVLADNERFLRVRDNTPLTTDRKRYIRLKVKR